MSVVVPPNLDPYIENGKEFAHIDILWMANLVDTVNSAFDIINARLVALGG
jgi:hypothetical protein